MVKEISNKGLKVDENFKEIKAPIEDAMSEIEQKPSTALLSEAKENITDAELF